MKKNAFQISVSLLIVCSVLLLRSCDTNLVKFLDRLELWTYDVRLKATMPEGVDTRIVIVDIDEKSLAEQGRWPWSRNKVAQLVDSLISRYKAIIVGFDVVFAEKDQSSGLDVLSTLAAKELKGDKAFQKALSRYRQSLDYDAVLARTMRGKPVILGYYFNNRLDQQKAEVSGLLPPPVFTRNVASGLHSEIMEMNSYGANIPILQKNAMGSGHFIPAVDMDGVVRRVPLLVEYKGSCYESLSLAILRGIYGNPPITPVISTDSKAIEQLAIADMKFPVDEHVAALVPYRGIQSNFPYISATDVISGKARDEDLEGAIVIVGTTAPGLMDLRSTPVSPVYPGVEIHANMIAGMLDQNIKLSPKHYKGIERIALLAAGLLLAFLLPRQSPVKSILLTTVLLAAVIAGNMAAWHHGLVFPLASILILIPALFIFNMSYGFLAEAKTRRHITGLFGQYVPPQIVDVMSRDPERFSMQAEEREMTVLFSDIVGFTSISEQLDPRDLSSLINEYLTAMTAVIYDHGGTVDKYIGDAIMAFWGAPLDDPEHARHAVEAALAMQRELEKVRTLCRERGWPELRIGIGLNSGWMRIGNMGSRYRVAYTVMGDTVNLASRLEGLTRQYGAGILIGEDTQKRIAGLPSRQIDMVKVKGKHVPVSIYEPLDDTNDSGHAIFSESGLFAQAVQEYRNQQWDLAEQHFSTILEHTPGDTACRLYLERISCYRQSPPPENWDGVYTATTK